MFQKYEKIESLKNMKGNVSILYLHYIDPQKTQKIIL